MNTHIYSSEAKGNSINAKTMLKGDRYFLLGQQ